MGLKEFIEKLKKEGKSAKEISIAIAQHDDFKDLSQEKIISEVEKCLKILGLSAAYSAQENEDAKKLQEDEVKRVAEEMFTEKMKSVNVDPDKSFTGKITKRWDHAAKKMISTDGEEFSEAHKTTTNLIYALGNKDYASATSISREIQDANKKSLRDFYGEKATVRGDNASVGGNLLPTEIEARINQRRYQLSRMLPIVNTQVQIVDDKIVPIMSNFTIDYVANQDTTLTEVNPTFGQKTVSMERIGAFTVVSNTILRQKGVDLTTPLINNYADASARWYDERLMQGNISGASNLHDGLIFLGTQMASPVALASLSDAELLAMLETINNESQFDRCYWVGNRKVSNIFRRLETTGGQRLYPEMANDREPILETVKFILNDKITNVLQVGEDNSTGGHDTALTLFDASQFLLGIDQGMVIESNDGPNFTKDAMTFRGVERTGWQLLRSDACIVQELTGASS